MNEIKEHHEESSSRIFLSHPVYKIEIETAEGVYLYDTDGRRYVDFEAGVWCASLGHNHPDVNTRLKEQLDRVTHLGASFISPATEAAARKLVRFASLDSGRAVFLSSGSEAVELSLRLARLYTGRKKLVTFTRSYLGAYGLTVRLDDETVWQTVNIDRCLACAEDNCSLDCPYLKHIRPEETAAFVLEPVLGSGGVIMPPTRCVRFLAKKIRLGGGLLIANEVTAGLGRTGRRLSVEHHDVAPDLVAFGKTLGNGYPVSAVVMKKEIAEKIGDTDFRYIQSHQNDPLGCAAAETVLDTIEKENLTERADQIGKIFKTALNAVKDKHAFIADVRGVGLMLGMEFKLDLPGGPETIEKISRQLLKGGFIVGSRPSLNLLRFLPPFIIEKNHIDELCRALDSVLAGL
ncbi:MAG: aspartate aminotransferase family protein [candidate division Zixibacteria bacterium]|nr:aspartate aminotransferase family protein [candidate division Zixibacteria bacterium]